jgi:hypothetical protein
MLVAYRLAGLSALEARYAGPHCANAVGRVPCGIMRRNNWRRATGVSDSWPSMATTAREPVDRDGCQALALVYGEAISP